ncbi:hypothetical protein DEO72_LG9g1157 [Vigna unguiculata]|uniref:Uncharacterized protein n=1 Tax=Vigna unguiculata TaxID=3917 RepID=A0A4D6MXH9_VIGUN|nr:hypothetical protein DEO72_LG9g1157 [Vigna unguiculata]
MGTGFFSTPLSPSIADCASVHEPNVTGIAPPSNSTQKTPRLRRRPRTTTIVLRRTLSLLYATAPTSLLRLLHHFQPPSRRQFSSGRKYRGCASSSIVIPFSRSQSVMY